MKAPFDAAAIEQLKTDPHKLLLAAVETVVELSAAAQVALAARDYEKAKDFLLKVADGATLTCALSAALAAREKAEGPCA